MGAVCSIRNHYLMMVKHGRDLLTCGFMNAHTHTNLEVPASTTVTVSQFLFVALVVVDR